MRYGIYLTRSKIEIAFCETERIVENCMKTEDFEMFKIFVQYTCGSCQSSELENNIGTNTKVNYP